MKIKKIQILFVEDVELDFISKPTSDFQIRSLDFELLTIL